MSITSFIRWSILKDNFLCSKCNLLIQVWLYISPDLGIVCIHQWLNFILFIFLSGVGTFFSTLIVQWYICLSTHLCILSSTWTVQCHIIILLPSRVPCVTDGWCYVILLSSVLCYCMEGCMYLFDMSLVSLILRVSHGWFSVMFVLYLSPVRGTLCPKWMV